MNVFSKAIYAGVLGLSFALTIAGLGQETAVLPQALGQDQKGKKWKYYGASTCANASCHGAQKIEKGDRPVNEYTTWKNKDRHAKAYDSLFNADSEEWVDEYNDAAEEYNESIKGTKKTPRKPMDFGKIAEDIRCINCHSTNVKAELRGQKYTMDDGVSCDGCHGPAEGWFKPHTKKHDYNDMIKRGMWDTRNIWRRADVCVSCHLQIDPALVDAGHPDLSFEIYAHTRREPPHWFERQSWDGIRAWSVGQAVSIRESLTKIQRRIVTEAGIDPLDSAIFQALSNTTIFRHGVAVLGNKSQQAAIQNLHNILLKSQDQIGRDLDKEWKAIIKKDPKKAKDEKAKKALAAAMKKSLKAALTKTGSECLKVARLMDAFGKELAKRKEFTKKQGIAIFKAVASDKDLLDTDEFLAEQAAGALYALYNTSQQGAGPRGKGPILTPKAIEDILIRPTVYKPDVFYDNEAEEFNVKLWLKRLEAAKKLLK
jgi:hypothetical protein